ncbi:Rho guanine nucleotide exchange factor 9 [Wickerhamomyces ciferrii]|uniref:Rho guanine nucleotide exchange factor 9 n=1 Tax=Wickerhamomyces ciferrii (strain ATCC 14091 / BCRC 22168 / CBS 111 / JCM 3599 / NBRC 0793 / NRRL Y-1031 F-60-10) TaxID=1206466 RepID=K0KMB8_WICCF|nr:Rho guanine nucleotide exchange factor 9 [Wickerhamomyces ciferrii]CCH44131.1 Rho guanine nucleotide exchange factor 9 [Wickerhamomyces ciferrii]
MVLLKSTIPDSSSSRPTTQSSIQSSNASLSRFNKRSKKDFVAVDRTPPVLRHSSDHCENADLLFGNAFDDDEDDDGSFFGPFSPLFPDMKNGFKGTNIQLGTNSGSLSDFLNDIPSSCVEIAYQKLSSGLLTGQSKDYLAFSDYTNSSQLTPCAINYNEFSPRSKAAFHRVKAIEEIIETEESYISCLKMLANTYLESLILKGNDGIPIRLIHGYTEVLISNHQNFLSELKSIFQLPYKHLQECDKTIHNDDNNELKSRINELVTCDSPLMAALVCKHITTSSISLFIYQEFSSLHDLVLKLINSKDSDPEFGLTLTKGYQNFLESTQIGNNRMDLSFQSLIQKPISRIAKYKLFLENLLKLTSIQEDPFCHSSIEDSLHKIDEQIKQINRYGLQEKFKANLLFESLIFNNKTLKFPVEYLGLPILSGSLHCSWVGKNRQIYSQILGAFLFKTHLVLAYIQKEYKFEVKFLIPLSVCKKIDINSNDDDDGNNNNSNMGGIMTNYKNSFKLIFEYNYTLIEVLCSTSDEFENKIWKDKLDILINHVNGPYKFDYSSSNSNDENGTYCSSIIPPFTLPLDAKINKFKSIRLKNDKNNIFNHCYFSDVIMINIELINDEENSIKYPYTYRSNSNENSSTTGMIIQFKEIEKARVEYLLQDLWSDELISNGLVKRKKTIKNKSNSTSRRYHQGSLRSLRSFGSRNLQTDDSINNDDDNTTSNKDSISRTTTRTTTSSKISIIRKTSIVFGSAFKSIINSDH